MRLFISINFDNNIKDSLLSVQEAMKLKGVRGHFTRPESVLPLTPDDDDESSL